MFTKVKIFNLALNALLLSKEITNADTDTSSEARVLRNHWDIALAKTLEELDLDSTSTTVTLELIETDPTDNWGYAYKYPTNCAFLRRIGNMNLKDDKETRIPLSVKNHNGVKVIFTNESEATADIVMKDVSLATLNPSAGLSVAYQLAFLSASLIVGKGAADLKTQIFELYKFHKAEAQKQDALENANFDDDTVVSEFVKARTT